jgi:hypothetical protein
MQTQTVDTHDEVWIDDGGLLHHGRAWVALPDVEWRLMEPLVAHMGERSLPPPPPPAGPEGTSQPAR